MGLLGAYGLINNQDEMQKAQLLAQAQAQQGLLPAQPAPQGLLGRVTSTPGFWQGLSQAGQGLVAASQGRPGYKPTWAQGISAGLGGFNQGMSDYAAQQLNQRIAQARMTQAEDPLKYQFGASVMTTTPDGKPAFAIPVQNPKTGEIETKVVPVGDKVLSRETGLTAQEAAALRAATAGSEESQKILARLGLTDQIASSEAQIAGTTEKVKTEAGAAADKAVSASNAADALYELDKIEKAIPNLPQTPVGMSWETFKSQFTGGDPQVQKAIGEIEQASGRMLKYVERLPGAATDADRQVFMASAGVINDQKATIQRKMAAIQAAKDSYSRLIQKYGTTPGNVTTTTPNAPQKQKAKPKLVYDPATGVAK